jgi:hypothetical protein
MRMAEEKAAIKATEYMVQQERADMERREKELE